MHDATAGLMLLVVAGVMNASFTLPMKFTKKWAWENTWTVWTLFALLILPPIIAYLTIPNLGVVYSKAGTEVIVLVAMCGLAWGVAQVLFGLAVNAIGIALGQEDAPAVLGHLHVVEVRPPALAHADRAAPAKYTSAATYANHRRRSERNHATDETG
jgi:L-rhamnose-H+ transport protein